MNEEYQITQKTGKNSDGNNIGIQNNYVGIPPEKAIEIVNKLFIENFPRLQEEALAVVQQRMDELQEKVFNQLAKMNTVNYNEFTDPDMQYAYYEAQKSYARFGTDELLNTLSDLIVSRVEKADNDYIKRVIDSAITTVGQLTTKQIDYLTVTFLIKNVKFGFIKDIETLKTLFNSIQSAFSPISMTGFSLLLSLGCLELNLDTASERTAKTYGLNKNEVKMIIPKEFDMVPADYAASDIGKMIAIMNTRKKTDYSFEIENFIICK